MGIEVLHETEHEAVIRTPNGRLVVMDFEDSRDHTVSMADVMSVYRAARGGLVAKVPPTAKVPPAAKVPPVGKPAAKKRAARRPAAKKLAAKKPPAAKTNGGGPTIRERVEEFLLRQSVPLKAAEIAEGTGVAGTQVYTHLGNLKSEGKLIHDEEAATYLWRTEALV